MASTFIEHGQEVAFFKEDSRIIRELNKRMSPVNVTDSLSRWRKKTTIKQIGEQIDLWEYESDELMERPGKNETRRGYHWKWLYPNDPLNHTIHYKVLDLMQQTIYATQKRIDVFTNIAQKYQHHPGYVFGVYFAALDKWIHEMHLAYSYISTPKFGDYNKHTIRDNIFYHQHLSKKHVDITYTVERVVHIHETMKPIEKTTTPSGPYTGPTDFDQYPSG